MTMTMPMSDDDLHAATDEGVAYGRVHRQGPSTSTQSTTDPPIPRLMVRFECNRQVVVSTTTRADGSKFHVKEKCLGEATANAYLGPVYCSGAIIRPHTRVPMVPVAIVATD